MFRFGCFAAALVGLSALSPAPAAGEVLIAPTRVVLERGERSAELVVVNKGDEEAAFRISVENRRMLEDGSMEAAAEALAGELFADELVRYAPRRVILPPGGRQTIRVSALLKSDLEPGEYRSHLRLMAVPTSAGRTLDRAAGETSENLSIQLIAIRSLTIPVILRVGDLDAEVSLDGVDVVEVEGDRDESLLVARLTRSGDRSTYGDIQVFVEGQSQPVYYARGVAVYTPNTTRDVILPIPNELRAQIQGKPLRVAYVSSDPSDQRTLAEIRTSLP